MSVRATYDTIDGPPGEPIASTSAPLERSSTSVGDIELRGRLPGATLLAIGAPAASVGAAEKSVSWLFSRKPRTIRRAPNAFSIELVIDTASPRASTIDRCVVAARSSLAAAPPPGAAPPGTPGAARTIERSPISAARAASVRRVEQRAGHRAGRLADALARQRDEVGVGDVAVAVGESQPRRLGEAVHTGCFEVAVRAHQSYSGRRRAPVREDLRDCEAARRRRRHPANPISTVVGAQGDALERPIEREVMFAEQPRVAPMRAHRRDDVARHFSGVQRQAALRGDARQGVGQRRVAQPVADRPGAALRVVEEGGGGGVFAQVPIAGQQRVQPRTDLETVARQTYRRCEQAAPRQPSVSCVDQFEHPHQPRHAHRAAADHCIDESHRLTIAADEQRRRRGRRRGLAAVVGAHGARAGVVVQQEGTAADA